MRHRRTGVRLMRMGELRRAVPMVLAACYRAYGRMPAANVATLRRVIARQAPGAVCARVRRQVGAGRAAVFVAGSRIQGVCLWHPQPGRLYCDWLFVAPEAQGQGIGGALIEALNGQAQRRHRHLQLDCLRHNQPSLAWYRRHGFRDLGPAPRRHWGRATLQGTLLQACEVPHG